MPQWLEIIIGIIGLIGTILGILGITTYINARIKHKAEKKNQENDKLETLKYNEHIRELKEIISLEISPIKIDLKEIKDDLMLVKKGTQATCRNDLEEMYSKADKEGFCSDDDKQKFEATYQIYHMLGNNGVMDVKREKLLKMPETKPVKCIRKKAKESEETEGD